MQKGAFAPAAFLALLGVASLLLIHVPAMGTLSAVCYQGTPIAGLVPPRYSLLARRRLGLGMLTLTCLFCAVGACCVFGAYSIIRSTRGTAAADSKN